MALYEIMIEKSSLLFLSHVLILKQRRSTSFIDCLEMSKEKPAQN